MRRLLGRSAVVFCLGLAACGNQTSATSGPPLATRNMPAVTGQQKTCAGRTKTFDLDVVETASVDLGMGLTFAAWAYDGHNPWPDHRSVQRGHRHPQRA